MRGKSGSFGDRLRLLRSSAGLLFAQDREAVKPVFAGVREGLGD